MHPMKLPPNQQLIKTSRWPVVGEKEPRLDTSPWRLSIVGLVDRPQDLALEELRQFPVTELAVDVHCVTRWSRLGMRFRGVPLQHLLEAAHVLPAAQFVSFVARSDRAHSTSLPLEYLRQQNPLVTWEAEGMPLSTEHGGPLRMVVPGKYFYKSLKWLETIEVLPQDRLGYWEAETGYHNGADPWKEERYVAPSLTKRDAAKLLAARDFEGRDLRGIRADNLVLAGLNARNAKLRDASFQKTILNGGDFAEANLSNAHLEDADLRGTSFRGSDLEGANFAGADLRGCDFRGASLFGASFVTIDGDGTLREAAVFDHATRIEASAVNALTDEQREFVLRSLSACGGDVSPG
jgi:DMSO/TMAO reductase YedYZ molybdopterin-dependent catalytic subunit